MEKSYENHFEKIRQFKIKQSQQKQRGLNDYNILTSVLSKRDEVRLHSRMIFSLLNPYGTHYQSHLFLDKFLEILNVDDFSINSKNCSVYKEYKNIDLYITDGSKYIIIENKIYAQDQKEQIQRYIETIQKENDNSLNSSDILVIYLTLDRDTPSAYSLGNLKIEGNFVKRESEYIALFKSIHYKKEILKWLKFCQYEVQNITNLNEVFKQYTDVVKMLTNQYKEKVMSLSEYIKDNESIYDMAMEIQQALPEARKIIIDSFFEKIIDSLQKELDDEWIVELKGDLSKRFGFPFRIYKKSWIGNKKNNLIFGFEFDQHNYYDGYFGIVRYNDTVDIKNISNQFKQKLEAIDFKLTTTVWWLHWECLGADDFAKYIKFNKNAEKDFKNRILELIKIFESDSHLMTAINIYLNHSYTKTQYSNYSAAAG